MEPMLYIISGVTILISIYMDDKKQVKKRTLQHLRERRIYEKNLK